MSESQSCAWHGTFREFLDIREPVWRQALSDHGQAILLPAGSSQLTAWKNCYDLLHRDLTTLIAGHPPASDWTILFEYVLPRERGRRPDVVILAGDRIFVLEFKDFAEPNQAHVDQTAAYARDLQHYHSASHQRKIFPVLVLTKTHAPAKRIDNVRIVGQRDLSKLLRSLAPDPECATPIDAEQWIHADYQPLPSLVAAARTIFNHEPLPSIRRAASAGIPETIAALLTIAEQAQQTNSFHLALVTGVPGAGKTLVGLQFVYASQFDAGSGKRAAVFLSGNGPLVKVLQHALQNKIFVQDVHGFLTQYGGNKTKPPEEHIWVYDEAQRAWDANRVLEKRRHGASEPEDFLRIGERKESWALMIGLIGEGQEIYLGEESGLPQWNDAIGQMSSPWTVHCPTKLAELFTNAHATFADDHLDLTASLRSHLAEDVQTWVRQLLEGDLESAQQTAAKVKEQGFALYATQDIDQAKTYVTERYATQEDKRFGLLASSKAKNLEPYGIRNGYNYTYYFKEGPWYNDPPNSPTSCCALTEVASEFQCQGLELDFPIVAWGNDLKWNGTKWASPPQLQSTAKDPHQLRVNSYRVLLSRGRDGLVIFVPPTTEMALTWNALLSAGARLLTDR